MAVSREPRARGTSGAERTVLYEDAALVDSQETAAPAANSNLENIMTPFFMDLLASPKGRVHELADFDEENQRAVGILDGT